MMLAPRPRRSFKPADESGEAASTSSHSSGGSGDFSEHSQGTLEELSNMRDGMRAPPRVDRIEVTAAASRELAVERQPQPEVELGRDGDSADDDDDVDVVATPPARTGNPMFSQLYRASPEVPLMAEPVGPPAPAGGEEDIEANAHRLKKLQRRLRKSLRKQEVRKSKLTHSRSLSQGDEPRLKV